MAVVTFNNNNTWTAPNNDIILVELQGGGGGGGSTSNNSATGGGAGGGAYARSYLQVIAGEVYSFNVGAGGARGSGNANGTTGGNTTFNESAAGNMAAIPLMRAAGGIGGNRNGALGAGGTVANSFGQTLFAGGSGASGNNGNNTGGGGGAGAGSNGTGAAGAVPTGGTGNGGGGNGGNGGYRASGTNAEAPGGGGGGSGNNNGGSKVGGNGGLGQVKITYNNNATVSGHVTESGANVAGALVTVIASENNAGANSIVVAVATSNATGDWTATVPLGKVITAVVSYNDAGNYHTAPGAPNVVST